MENLNRNGREAGGRGQPCTGSRRKLRRPGSAPRKQKPRRRPNQQPRRAAKKSAKPAGDRSNNKAEGIGKHPVNTSWRMTASRRYWRHVEDTRSAARVLATAHRGAATERSFGAQVLPAAPDQRT